jgi:tRNA threonylcarbamoyl adenosine modification protein YeaZ
MAAQQDNFNNPLILAIETSGRLGSVAIAQGEQVLGEKHFTGPMRHSAEVFPAIVALLEQFGKPPNQIEQVYLSIGPGSFTGLRIAVTIAKTMALARQSASPPIGEVSPAELNSARRTKIVAVDTLDVIAANVIGGNCETNLRPNERLATILDAKRGQFFIAVYEQSAKNDLSFSRKRESSVVCPLTKILPDCLMTADEFLDRFAGCGKPIALIGEGLVYYKDKFDDPAARVLDEKFWNPSAANVHKLGWELAKQDRFADPITLTPNYIRGPDVKIKQV